MNPHTHEEKVHEVISQTVIAAPSITAIVVAKVLDLHINDWLGLLGIGFLLLQAIAFVWRWQRDIQIEKERVAATRAFNAELEKP